MKFVHRDLKLDNFFLSDNLEVKIGDFGLAGDMHNRKTRNTICGTPNYIAPEIHLNKGYSYEVDIWSMGIVAYLLFCGYYPF